jgi:hypothetical protein
LLTVFRMMRIGGSLASGGLPRASSMRVMPNDQMSADASYLHQSVTPTGTCR